MKTKRKPAAKKEAHAPITLRALSKRDRMVTPSHSRSDGDNDRNVLVGTSQRIADALEGIELYLNNMDSRQGQLVELVSSLAPLVLIASGAAGSDKKVISQFLKAISKVK